MLRPLLLLLLAIATPVVTAYPSWLKCYVDLDNSENVMGAEIMDFEDSRHKVYIEVKGPEDTEWTVGYEYKGATTLKARLKVPDSFEDSSFEFVIESTEGAKLEPPFCEGRRSVGREWNAEVDVNIDGTQDRIDLWAGWARGYEQVKLTQRTVLWKQGAKPDDYEEEEEL